MNYRETITRLSRENISVFDDAGCGMFNLDIEIPNFRQYEAPYSTDMIFQIYPYPDNQFYGLMYILMYTIHSDGEVDNTCIRFEDLSDDEQKIVYDVVEKEVNK